MSQDVLYKCALSSQKKQNNMKYMQMHKHFVECIIIIIGKNWLQPKMRLLTYISSIRISNNPVESFSVINWFEQDASDLVHSRIVLVQRLKWLFKFFFYFVLFRLFNLHFFSFGTFLFCFNDVQRIYDTSFIIYHFSPFSFN